MVACARFDRMPAHGAAILEVETDKGETVRQELAFPTATPSAFPDGLSTVARVAAAARLKELDDVAGLETALRYRLVSPWTNWLVVAPRTDEEKAQDLPALRKVPQTLAAGWGGVGSVAMSLSMDALAAPRAMYSRSVDFAAMENLNRSDIETPWRALTLDLPEPYRRLLELVDANASRLDVAGAFDLLTESGLAAEFDDLFRHTADLGLTVDVVAAIVLARLLGGPLGEFLSGDAQLALASLQERTREATDALQQIGHHGVALARLTQEPAAREVLRQQSDREALARLARIRELLDHLDEAVRRSEERLQRERASHAHREVGGIA